MKNFMRYILLACLATQLAFSAAFAQQKAPRFAKYAIAETGCAAYLPADPGEFELSYSEDNSEVYTGEAEDGGFQFAVILVKFSEPIGTDEEMTNGMMEAYLDYLQGAFAITSAAGYGYGHRLESAPEARGVIDYWEDEEGVQYVVKAWCNGDFLAVLMLYGSKEYPHFNAQQLFLDGFRFPED